MAERGAAAGREARLAGRRDDDDDDDDGGDPVVAGAAGGSGGVLRLLVLPAVLPGVLRRVQVLQLRQGVRRRRRVQAGLPPARLRGGSGERLHHHVM